MSDYLHHELLAQFLKRLSVKALLRCRSVCKWWKQVIDSQSFIEDHLALQNPRLILQNSPFKYLIIDPPALPKFDTLRGPIHTHDYSLYPSLICSVHGVICLHYSRALHLWNPSIRRLTTIPLPDFLYGPSKQDYYDHEKWFSFWIDPSNNHSKILIVRYKVGKIHLFSSSKRAWTEDSSDIKDLWERWYGGRRQVLINGVAYWIADKPNGRLDRPGSGDGVVVYFDFTEDRYGTIDVPNEATVNANVFEWQHSLSLLYWVNGACNECHLWATQNGSWAKMFIFEIPDNVRVGDILHVEASHSRVLAQTKNGHLVLYDPEFWRKRIASRFKFISLTDFNVSYDFVESLVFPDLGCMSSD